MKKDKLWTCPRCGKSFVTKNLWHSCTNYTIDDFFRGKNDKLRKVFDAYLKFVERNCGKVIVNVDKTRISFQTRTRFAGVPRMTKSTLYGGFWLKHKIENSRFTKVEFLPPNNYVYQFPINDETDLDEDVASWIRAACKVGNQE